MMEGGQTPLYRRKRRQSTGLPPYLWTSHPENEGHRPRDNKGSLVAVDT
jgi:hypothetical protein